MGLDVGIRVCCCCGGGVRVGPEDDGVPAPNSSGTNLLLEALDDGAMEGVGDAAKGLTKGEADVAGDLKSAGTNLLFCTGSEGNLKESKIYFVIPLQLFKSYCAECNKFYKNNLSHGKNI